ncbi:MAG: HAD family hydrolase [Candidatus Helarchaeota archaeon]
MDYLEYKNNHNGDILIREKNIEDIKNLNNLIFDCDGVLLNTSKSFDQAIKDTAEDFFTKILLLNKPIKPFVSNKDIILLRNTGGLGNDWDLSFVIILYYMACILLKFNSSPKKKREIYKCFKKLPRKYNTLQNRIDGLKSLQKLFYRLNINSNYLISNKDNGNYRLLDLTNKMDSTGLRSAKSALLSELVEQYDKIIELWDYIENLFGYQKLNLENPIKRIFEEIYLGSYIFKKIYKAHPKFYFGSGRIETEKLIPSIDFFQKLISNYSINKFGIASSRPSKQALYVLEPYKILEYFNSEALIFLNDIYKEERRVFKDTGNRIRLEKPHPFSLIKSAEKLRLKNDRIGYIGDTASDFIAVENANIESNYKFYSICVYGSSSEPEKLKNKFKELGANIIIEAPNDLLVLFEKIGREKI